MSTSAERLDIVESGAPSGQPRRARSAAVLAVIVLLGAGARWVDDRERRQSFDALMACVGSGQAAISDGRARASFMSDYIQPAISSGPAPDVRAGLYELVQQAAAGSLPTLRAARAGCRRVDLLPWHSGLRTAHASYLAYVDDELAVAQAIAAEGSEIYAERPRLLRLRERASAALTATAPDDAAGRARSALVNGISK
jgi:hypothetical protein